MGRIENFKPDDNSNENNPGSPLNDEGTKETYGKSAHPTNRIQFGTNPYMDSFPSADRILVKPDDANVKGDRTHVFDKTENKLFPERLNEICRILDSMHLAKDRQQMIVVVGSNWDSKTGTMQLCKRVHGHWHPTGESWLVDVGKKGMGWGRGLIENGKDLGLQKHEGDGKAPAGLFELGNAFGAVGIESAHTKMSYRRVGDRDFFVDDVQSPDYNHWVTLDSSVKPEERWGSFERMQRSDGKYNLGIVVDHNMTPTAIPGDGSAIFLHLWKEPGTGTAGCTSMSEDNMHKLLDWLDPAKKPLLLQIPGEAIGTLKDAKIIKASAKQ